MSNKQKFWTWVFVIIAVVIVLIVLFGKKQAGSSSNTGGSTSASANKAPAPSGQTAADKSGVDTTKPPMTIQGSTFAFGDKIYAGEDTLNAYESCPPTTQNIYATFNKGDYIGTYVATDNNCIGVTTKVYLLGFLPAYSKDVYLFDKAKVYKA